MSIQFSYRSGIMQSLLSQYGLQIKKLIEGRHPNYILPLETKGALLIDEAFSCIGYKPNTCNFIYRRTLDYLSEEELSKSRFLVLDDSFVTGRSLKETKKLLIDYGVAENNISLVAFMDLSNSKDLHQDVYKETIFIDFDKFKRIGKDLVYQAIESEILQKEMPSVCDHLVFKAKKVNQYKYLQILDELDKTNRLLYYNQRGDFYAGILLLDDLYNPNWPTPAKIRFWYKPFPSEFLLFVPMAFPPSSEKIPVYIGNFYNELLSILSKHTRKISNIGIEQDKADAASISVRVNTLKYLKPLFKKLNIKISFYSRHMPRYYYNNFKELINIIKKYYNGLEAEELPVKTLQDETIITYLPLAKRIIERLKDCYLKNQENVTDRKNFNHKGFTIPELVNYFSNEFTQIQLHAAIDYCCDKGYVVPFWDNRDSGRVRCLRTTEKDIDFFIQALGCSIIYSQERPCHAWFLDKTFGILNNVKKNIPIDDVIAVSKGPYGDYCRIRRGEQTSNLWKDFPTEFWEVEKSNRKDDEGEYIIFKQIQKKRDSKNWADDQRLQMYKMSIEAITFLLRQGKYKAGVLLNILTGLRGGLDYINYNIEKILNFLFTRNFIEYKDEIEKHLKGAQQKVDYIKEVIFSNQYKDTILENLERKCSRLNEFRLLKEEALNIVSQAKAGKFPDNRIYTAYIELFTKIVELANAKLCNNTSKSDNIIHFLKVISNNEEPGSYPFNSTLKWLYAFEARECNPRTSYELNKFEEKDNNEYWILCYDIKGSSLEKEIKTIGSTSVINNSLKSMAKNWIIALGGKLTPDNVNSGDLEYGIFTSPIDAIQCACWISYHSEQLAYTHPYFPKNGAFGFALAHGRANYTSTMGVSGDPLNLLGHFLKNKIMEISGEAGRERSVLYRNSNVHILNKGEFGNISEIFIKNEKTIADPNENKFEVSAIDIKEFIGYYKTPWAHRLKKS